MGFFSYSEEKLILNVTGGILGTNWLGRQEGIARIDGDSLVLSDFEGSGAVTLSAFPFTRK